ncbi:hypothetical protein KTJ32_02185 [Acinetobacter gyllenbergii]|uniref:hypothetical protein n=1 Tax=Acinetobacter gyllenbergii TaxID=134534 RepID=UPI000806B6C2|nr:hypothetical protein [Acinetobacter gyllenbergii]MCU4579810.1 hypothetical protein [Acinetobacter gyllenbergii]OBY74404.1 hypothetical protein NG55_11320 [Acinetobacter gyllenbergii]
MANSAFELQYSRFAFVLQLLLFILILSVLYPLLPLWWWLLSVVMMSIAWLLFLQQPQIRRFQYLDHQDCSFEFSDPTLKIQRRQIVKILDHQLYIALYFSHKKHKPCIIWWDQLSYSQWKKLKVQAKLG